jgi:hypothetical protein
MEFTTDIGTNEKHQLHVKFDQTLGKVLVQVDGADVAVQWRWFSLHRTRRYELSVGDGESHAVVIELTRKALVGGFRTQTCRVLVDGERLETYVGDVSGRTSKAA